MCCTNTSSLPKQTVLILLQLLGKHFNCWINKHWWFYNMAIMGNFCQLYCCGNLTRQILENGHVRHGSNYIPVVFGWLEFWRS